MIPGMMALVPLPAIVAAALGATDRQRADLAARVMAACPSNTDRARLVAQARAFLTDLESAW